MTTYIGRFAPSPSGPLHFGSLVCALASYLDAKKNHGKWLVRIEDIDPPREVHGAADQILNTIIAHGLHWDDTPIYQSQRSFIYESRLKALLDAQLAYRCSCVRKRLNSLNGAYDKHCISKPPQADAAAALRLNVDLTLEQLKLPDTLFFDDKLQGTISQNIKTDGDFIIHRKDGLYAYQLAVVSDDIDQGITHVVRGCDLLETSVQQRLLHRIFNNAEPSYMHTPLVIDDQGKKLSKQNHAPAIDNTSPANNVINALNALGIHVPKQESLEKLVVSAIEQWPPAKLRYCKELNYLAH